MKKLAVLVVACLADVERLTANQIFDGQFDFCQAVFYQSRDEWPQKLDFVFKNDEHVRVGIFQQEEAFLNRQACFKNNIKVNHYFDYAVLNSNFQ